MPSLPAKFGPRNGIDSKDYVLYMSPPGGNITERPVNLLGHSLTSPNQNLTDPVTFTEVVNRNGDIVTVSRVKRAARETSRTYTVGFGSALWTPAIEVALRSGCTTVFFMIYNCAEDRRYDHWDILPEATLNPPVEAEDVITNQDDTNIINLQAEMSVPEKLRGYELGWDIIYNAGAGVDIRDIAFKLVDCQGCPTGFAQDIVAVGGDGTAIPAAILTDSRFAGTPSVLTTGGAAATVAQCVYQKDDFIAVGTLITATTGAIRVSYDNGATWAAVTGVAEPILDIIDVGGTLVAVGGDTTGGGVVYFSDDNFASVTAVTSDAIPADQPLSAADFDVVTQKLYIVGGAGTVLTGRFNGDNLRLTDVSASLGSANNLLAVLVRGENEIVVGGAAAELQQSYDGGVTWSALAIAGTDDVTGIAGNRWRMMVVTDGGDLFQQTAPTNYLLRAVTLEDGQTLSGAYSCITMNSNGDFNRFIAGTTEGEIVMGVPFYPGA